MYIIFFYFLCDEMLKKFLNIAEIIQNNNYEGINL